MPVTIRGRFQRSINLARDFYSEHDLSGYVVTAKARELIGRVNDALENPTAQRAWSVTGPYGGGKSAFALFLAHLLRGDDTATSHLREADSELASRFELVRSGTFCPVLIVGSREPIGPALMSGLSEALRSFAEQYERKLGRPSRGVQEVRESLRELADEANQAARKRDESAALSLFERAANVIQEATGGGLLIVVDELGKLLEHAALYPEEGDLFILQQLAERAARSESKGGDDAAPILLFTILHQAFERYAGRLNQAQRDEWQKVQGRFADIGFVEPISETLRLLAHAVQAEQPERLPERADALVSNASVHGALPASADPEWVETQLHDALPLHPAVSLLVGPLFRRLAQNERSLFAFLASGEPHSFLDVVGRSGREGDEDLFGQSESIPLYRLDHLYDYLVTNLGATLFSERMNRLWAETETALASLREPDTLQIRLVKNVALLGFAGQLAGLAPKPEILALTSDAPAPHVEAALAALTEARVLTHRPFKDEYHVWQGSDFDLAARLHEARSHVPLRTSLAELLAQTVPPVPVMARRHSHRTGTTRVFEVVYASDETWLATLQKPPKRTDGRIIYVLPEHDDTAQLIEQVQQEVEDPLTLVAIPDGVGALREAARDLACLDWVREHASELEGDAAARKEVSEQRAALAAEVERRLTTLLVADADGRNPCTWITREATFRLGSERALQQKLSALCDEVFAHAPEIWNELLNRRKPSSSAVRGLKLLLDAMIHRGDEARLGIEGYPAEYGMYASILQATGMHRASSEAEWEFVRPSGDTRPGCAAVWDAIAETLRSAGGKPLPVNAIYETLSEPPFGVRPGLIPVFLFAFYKHVEDEIAFYENDTFVRDLSFETTERLLKSEEKGQHTFTIQWVEIEGARATMLVTLAPLLGLATSVDKPLPVAIRILRRIHDLPPYVRHTAALSEHTLAVREALQRATDPTVLLFEDLPEACGVGSFLTEASDGDTRADRFADRLQDALRELSGAYDTLLGDIEASVATAFRLHADSTEGRRHELAERAHLLLPAASDLRLKAFLVRATDEILDTKGWYESLAALLANRPPSQWSDEDHSRFRLALREVAQAFYKLEPLAFDLASDGEQKAGEIGEAQTEQRQLGQVRRVRLFVQTLRETEQDGIIHIHQEDDALVDELYRQLADTVHRTDMNADVKLAALSRLAAELLNERTTNLEDRPHE